MALVPNTPSYRSECGHGLTLGIQQKFFDTEHQVCIQQLLQTSDPQVSALMQIPKSVTPNTNRQNLLYKIQSCTSHLSFFPRTTIDWNTLEQEIGEDIR